MGKEESTKSGNLQVHWFAAIKEFYLEKFDNFKEKNVSYFTEFDTILAICIVNVGSSPLGDSNVKITGRAVLMTLYSFQLLLSFLVLAIHEKLKTRVSIGNVDREF